MAHLCVEHMHKQTDRQTDRQIDRQTDRPCPVPVRCIYALYAGDAA